MTASLFGKLPSQLDYVRVAHDAPLAITFDAWLQQAVQELAKVQGAWPTALVRFVFAPQPSPFCLVGVLADSRDRAGRRFPLAVYRVTEAGAYVRSLAALPRAAGIFLQAASALLEARDTLQRDDLPSRLAVLPELDAGSLAQHAADLARELASRTPGELVESTKGRLPSIVGAAEKLHATLHGDQSNGRSITVGLPYGAEVDAGLWLSLARGLMPSLFWTEPGESGRLFLTRGAPAPLLPLWLSEPARRHPRLVALEDAQGAAPEASDFTNLSELIAHFTLKGPF